MPRSTSHRRQRLGRLPSGAARADGLRGRQRLDDRRVLNGIVWKFRTDVVWRDVPERYGPWATLHTRFRGWAMDGTFDRMLRAAQAKADAAGDIEWLVAFPRAGRLPAVR
ncbi:transposase [Streptomyces sp. NPDC007945]|uniref:transposase n=1 Tax=Streptomyces sp. NPDC007945 TaxID=3364797 RepID=UPI0036EE0D3F